MCLVDVDPKAFESLKDRCEIVRTEGKEPSHSPSNTLADFLPPHSLLEVVPCLPVEQVRAGRAKSNEKVATHPVSPVTGVVTVRLAVEVIHGSRRFVASAQKAPANVQAALAGGVVERIPRLVFWW